MRKLSSKQVKKKRVRGKMVTVTTEELVEMLDWFRNECEMHELMRRDLRYKFTGIVEVHLEDME